MKKYFFKGEKFKENHAGFKARMDCEIILENIGYKASLYKDIHLTKNSLISKIQRFVLMILKIVKIRNNSIIVINYPQFGEYLIYCINVMRKLKKCLVILLVHDIDSIRTSNCNKKFEQEKKIFAESDYIISHNEKMTKILAEKYNVNYDKIVNLYLFDYLMNNQTNDIRRKFEEAVVVAGNLDINKAGYVYKLADIFETISLNTYGPNCNLKKFSGNYKGSFLPEEIPNVLNGKYGLVWDGESLDSCKGDYGNYLRYNNPHKVSLYLVSGLPVIIWKQAALAELIETENLGIVVENLYELEERILSVSEKEYQVMLSNVERYRKKLLQGKFLQSAIEEVERRIKQNNYGKVGK